MRNRPSVYVRACASVRGVRNHCYCCPLTCLSTFFRVHFSHVHTRANLAGFPRYYLLPSHRSQSPHRFANRGPLFPSLSLSLSLLLSIYVSSLSCFSSHQQHFFSTLSDPFTFCNVFSFPALLNHFQRPLDSPSSVLATLLQQQQQKQQQSLPFTS